MRGRALWVSLMVIACAAIALLAWHQYAGRVSRQEPSSERVTVAPKPPRTSAPAQLTRREPPSPAQTLQAPPAVPNSGLHAQADDHLSLVQSLLSKAQQGEAAAQLALYQALEYCESGYRSYFDQADDSVGQRRSLQESLALVAEHAPGLAEDVQRVYAKCRTLMESDRAKLGGADDWLRKAAGQGVPIAQALFAQARIAQSPTPVRDSAAEVRHSEAYRLLAAAVRSKDPDVLWVISEQQSYLQESGDQAALDQWAWKLLACQKGLDCSASARWYQLACSGDNACQAGESGQDFLRRAAGTNLAEIETRAAQLANYLERDQWDALGFPN